MTTLIKRFIKIALKNHKLILVACIFLILISGLLASSLKVDSGMSKLLPEDNPIIKASLNIEKEFGDQDKVFLVASGEPTSIKEFFKILEEEITKKDISQSLFYKYELEGIKNYAPLFIPKNKYSEIQSELEDDKSQLSQYLSKFDISSMIALFEKRIDTLGYKDKKQITDIFLKTLLPDREITNKEFEKLTEFLIFGKANTEINENTIEQNGYIASKDKRYYLMIIKPKISLENYAFDRDRFFKELDNILLDVSKNNLFNNIQTGYTGGQFVIDYQGDQAALNNFASTALITLILILLFIIISFRKIIVPFASIIPLVLGVVLTSMFAALVYKKLNLFSISFASLLLGLGIDFAVHIISRYSEEKANGKSIEVAMTEVFLSTGKGMIIGALTTAVAFAVFVFAEFKAFTQMGIICAIGIVFALMSIFLFLPSIIIWTEIKNKKKTYQNVEFSFLKPIGTVIISYRRLIVICVLIILGISLYYIPGIQLNADLQSLYPKHLPAAKWIEVLKENFEYNPDTISLYAADIDELTYITSELKKKDSILKVESVLDYIPKDQEYKIRVLELIKQKAEYSLNRNKVITAEMLSEEQLKANSFKLREDLARLKNIANNIYDPSLAASLQKLIEELSGSQSTNVFFSFIKKQQSITKITRLDKFNISNLTENDLPKSILSKYKGSTGKYLINIIPKGSMWDDKVRDYIKNDIESVVTGQISGLPYIMKEIADIISRDIIRISLITVLAIFVFLLVSFRSIKHALIGMSPIIATIIIVLGLGKKIGAELNIINIMSFPMIFGIGIDSSIHIMHRLREQGVDGIPDTAVHTGKAVIITTLTTIFGFGSFIFSNHPGLVSLAKIVILGLGTSLVLSIFLVPALYAISSKR